MNDEATDQNVSKFSIAFILKIDLMIPNRFTIQNFELKLLCSYVSWTIVLQERKV